MAKSPSAPFTAPTSGDLTQRLAIVAQAINRKADATGEPTFNSIILVDELHQSWTVTVNSSGVISATPVPRA